MSNRKNGAWCACQGFLRGMRLAITISLVPAKLLVKEEIHAMNHDQLDQRHFGFLSWF